MMLPKDVCLCFYIVAFFVFNVTCNRVPLTRLRLKNKRNMLYTGMISLGNPPQTFDLTFDTGSTDIVVRAYPKKRRCRPGDELCENMMTKQYNPLASSTFKRLVGIFKSTYADNTYYNGYLGSDTLRIGTEKEVTIPKVPIAVAEEGFDEADHDGIFGLGLTLGSASDINYISPVECIISQMKMIPQVGLYFEKIHTKEVVGGELYFGGYNPEFVQGDFVYIPMQPKPPMVYDGWRTSMDKIVIAGVTIDVANNDFDGDGEPGTLAAIDSGASIINFPRRLGQQVEGVIFSGDRQGLREFAKPNQFINCNSFDYTAFPTIEFYMNNQKFTLGAEDYIFRDPDDIHLCGYGISLIDKPRLLLGYPFLTKYYTVFDYERRHVGFALAKHKQQPEPDEKQKLKNLLAKRNPSSKNGLFSATTIGPFDL